MHARDLAELAALLALANSKLARRLELLSDEDTARLDAVLNDRHECWMQALSDWREASRGKMPPRDAWRGFQKVIDEILLAEVLTRVLGALADSQAHFSGNARTMSLLRQSLERNLAARHRAWSLLTTLVGLPGDVVCAADALRRSLESWTDLLLAHLDDAHVAVDWAVDARRLVEFRSDLAAELGLLPDRTREDLLIESLRAAARDGSGPLAANPALNQEIAEIVARAFDLPSRTSAADKPAPVLCRCERVDAWDQLSRP